VQTQRHSWGWVVSFTSSLLDPQRKRPHHPKWIIRVTKMGRFRWTERVARWGNNRNTYHILEENVMREYVDVKWIIIHVSKAQCRILWISCFYRRQFSGAFAKLRKATISFVMSVRPSAVWKISAPTGQIFIKFDIWGFFENLSRKFKFRWNRSRTLHEDQFTFLIISRSILVRIRNVSEKKP